MDEEKYLQVMNEQDYLVIKHEPVVAEVIGGGTSAEILYGTRPALPEGAVMVTPNRGGTTSPSWEDRL